MSTPEGLNPQDRAHTLWQGNLPNRAPSTTLCPKNKSLHIFTAPNFDKNMIVDLASAAWASTIHPMRVLFNLRKLVSARDVDDVLSDRVGRMTSLTLRYTRSKDLLTEAFFTDPSSRTKATSDELTYQNTRIIATLRLPSNCYIVKVNLYHINACDPSTDILKPIENAFRPFGKIVQLRAYLSHRGTFYGEATIYLDTSEQDEVRSLPSRLHLGGSLSCLAELRSTDITPVCGYCREEGHYLRSCTKRSPLAPRTSHLAANDAVQARYPRAAADCTCQYCIPSNTPILGRYDRDTCTTSHIINLDSYPCFTHSQPTCYTHNMSLFHISDEYSRHDDQKPDPTQRQSPNSI
ncbi:hypothetical protein PHYBLDRAFT_138437 [Phycomyces blakesleeanus NRRL 1555(-)]|uniref:CCHC-type zinc finger transcription factor n=1 Tax=Phycomyces blakesleeanus (strain ATCC 8743b / DSM 1359 / FGSC 10004 / NBRC 33097 / NRRL 1555) TaxID=763407 RepID=A0A162V901_PHYB8|nr:hypothetical protein PHYBLDRAFT_138437 [Phycomyces blakesleeanus NRRL 1555(-)]OAD80882.1 hypothetical protein PHYBLDRAFT_138437 [Phycomyces blakesleeanus NRRL 1555(-)]|eukprot:XP_018298922.1 hypothetical protein PHYBLDRAFT_138437 [Phycomyces blakesleeanus NRRL 1555(-)]